MSAYYVNDESQDNGDHEVHISTCTWLPGPDNRTYLGDFASCGPAVIEAKTIYETANGCAHCCEDCHTT